MNTETVTVLTHRNAAGVHQAIAGRYEATCASPTLAARLAASKHFDVPEDRIDLTFLRYGVLLAEVKKPVAAKPAWHVYLARAAIAGMLLVAAVLAWIFAQGGPQ